jgi:Zn finger protein HypA/HybF involved in hydrogenase expression
MSAVGSLPAADANRVEIIAVRRVRLDVDTRVQKDDASEKAPGETRTVPPPVSLDVFSGASLEQPTRRDTMYTCLVCGEETQETAMGDFYCPACDETFSADEMVLQYGPPEDYEQDESRWHKDTARVKDAVARAFEKLNEGTIVARANFSCCQSCACSEIEDEAAEGDTGYCFYHAQDNDGLKERARLYLAFGSMDEDANDEEYVKVGNAVVAALAAEADLKVEWDKSAATRILVTAS